VTILNENRDVMPAESEAADAMLAAAGDALAFERLYRRHVARVSSLARRMIGQDDAEDATQAVFIRAWEKLGTFRGESAFGTWLHRLAINVMLARRTTLGIERGRFQDGEGTVEGLTSRSKQPELSIDFEEAIEQLPNGAREVFVLHDIEGYKHEEIAEMCGITAGGSKAQLHRARLLLREALTR
jgi:RNA polymerase sigma-70 factor (ECF subfamily)